MHFSADRLLLAPAALGAGVMAGNRLMMRIVGAMPKQSVWLAPAVVTGLGVLCGNVDGRHVQRFCAGLVGSGGAAALSVLWNRFRNPVSV